MHNPDTFDPIISKDNPIKIPKLSDVFKNINQKDTIKRETFFSKLKYTAFKLTRGELEQIFNLIDQEKKDEITITQWERENKKRTLSTRWLRDETSDEMKK